MLGWPPAARHWLVSPCLANLRAPNDSRGPQAFTDAAVMELTPNGVAHPIHSEPCAQGGSVGASDCRRYPTQNDHNSRCARRPRSGPPPGNAEGVQRGAFIGYGVDFDVVRPDHGQRRHWRATW